MNGTREMVSAYVHGINAALEKAPQDLIGVYCPPMPYLAHTVAMAGRLKVGAQNCHAEKTGAFTGEVSADMLAELGCAYVIVGHSERRATGETCAGVLAKAAAAIAAGITPIICVGESQTEYDAQQTSAVLSKQLAVFTKLAIGSYLIAYEPVWAIGSGKTPSAEEIMQAHAVCKTVLGSATSVLYGGSVNAGNAHEILNLSGVSGALIGSASLTISGMTDIINAARG
jgi:triosephosphate isomerase (TIM)